MSTSSPTFGFGSFGYFCNSVALPLCPIVENKIEPECYSRNIEIGGLLIFEPATLVIQFVALIMTTIMIYHIKNKYTAVGRKEIVMFFYMYMLCLLLEFFLVSGIIPPSSPDIYMYFVAGQVGLQLATVWCLLLNGFVGFQWAEDGTPLSLWSIRVSSLVVAGASYFVAIGTFKDQFGFDVDAPVPLFIVYFAFGAAFVVIYVLLQVVLVINTLDDRWPLGDILFGFMFFALGQVLAFVASKQICEMAKHYVDGMFFANACTLLGVMMVYKYWDSITKEDLEFSVGGKANNWEIKDPLLNDDAMSRFASGGAPAQQQQQGGDGRQQQQQGDDGRQQQQFANK